MLTIDTHKLSDKIAISPLHSVKDVTGLWIYSIILNNFKTELIFFLILRYSF